MPIIEGIILKDKFGTMDRAVKLACDELEIHEVDQQTTSTSLAWSPLQGARNHRPRPADNLCGLSISTANVRRRSRKSF
jgi:hypothetical protein